MEVKDLHDEMQKTLTEFRQYVDREVAEAKKGAVAPETTETLDRLNKRIDELQAKMERPAAPKPQGEKSEYGKAFEKFARRGDPIDKAAGDNMNVDENSGADGGYAVPTELDRQIYSLMQNESPMRGICNVIQVANDNYQKLVNKHGVTSGWVDENDARAETKTPVFAQLTPYMGEVYALAPATQKVLDDAFFNVEQFLATEIGAKFATDEDAAFVVGTGTKQPKGVLGYATAATADDSRAFGTIEHIAAGAAGAWGAGVNPLDKLTDLTFAMRAGQRNGCRWLTNKAMVGELRKLKDGKGNYLWQPAVVAGQPATLLGYPVTEDENVPAKGADSLSIAFGNFQRAYTIVDRIGIRVLRDPYTKKPYVLFYATKRVGGFLIDSEAVKVIKFAAA